MHWAGEEIRLQSDDASELRKMALDFLDKEKDPAKEQLEKVLLNTALETSPISFDNAEGKLPTLFIPTVD